MSGGFFPISCVLGSNDIFENIKPGNHGSTYGGNPLACVTAVESIKVILDEKLSENSLKMGELIKRELRTQLKDN